MKRQVEHKTQLEKDCQQKEDLILGQENKVKTLESEVERYKAKEVDF